MPGTLQELITRLRGDHFLGTVGEDAVKMAVILPILSQLGWDRDNIREVVPEFTSGSGRVDYCLRIGERNSVFLEAKKPGEDLDRHQEQLLEYAFRSGVEIAVLTNGFAWWLYLPLAGGSWDQRKFYAIDIHQQEVTAVLENFTQFLSRQAIDDGSALSKAKEIHAGRTKGRVVKETLSKAWSELCLEPDESLVQLLVEKVESLCGHRPTAEEAGDFLAQLIRRDDPLAPVVGRVTNARDHAPVRAGAEQDWTGRSPIAFSFQGQSYGVNSFKGILLKLASLLHQIHGSDFETVLTLRGTIRPYFARDGHAMTEPREIPGTGIYADTALSANAIRGRCLKLLWVFNYPEDALNVEFQAR